MTPREAFLEQQVKQLTAELNYTKALISYDQKWAPSMVWQDPTILASNVADTRSQYTLAGRAAVSVEGVAMHFMAQTYSDDPTERMGYSYFLNQRTLDQAGNPQAVLNMAYKQLFNELTKSYA